ncbi:toprim domain-containing protein [Neorhodopirellula pilleata]|uniref:DNA topoisomerase (ATP-hydrolyzing) n=1 Tax=Neorhodopirellula pilleata TaxID=2714738 RepID=A0A5C6AFK2_9BACT|nr:toprim domain-containing protein [Neorhodopirellula pilleata]TWT98812.1 DNA gyrase subunit B [Neorhodopirellula pilleata]
MRLNQYSRPPVHYPCAESDSVSDSSAAECFFVEGDSAAKTVDQVRDRRLQAILALQGKPLNANRASKRVAGTNEVFLRIAEALIVANDHNLDPPNASHQREFLDRLDDVEAIRYHRVVLLMDPDADGIHCGVLMMAFFRRFSPAFIEAGRLWLVRPPMFLFRFPVGTLPLAESPVAYSPEHADAIEHVLRSRKMTGFKKIKHRGLGSIDAAVLQLTCIDPQTRHCERLSLSDVDHAIGMFGN